jgi:hypothetical protein
MNNFSPTSPLRPTILATAYKIPSTIVQSHEVLKAFETPGKLNGIFEPMAPNGDPNDNDDDGDDGQLLPSNGDARYELLTELTVLQLVPADPPHLDTLGLLLLALTDPQLDLHATRVLETESATFHLLSRKDEALWRRSGVDYLLDAAENRFGVEAARLIRQRDLDLGRDGGAEGSADAPRNTRPLEVARL